MNLGITAYSACTEKGLYRNGQLVFGNSNGSPFSIFAKDAYRFMEPGYAKFYKMDELCKLAFLAAEVMLKEKKLESDEEGADIAIVLGNKHSSLSSDLRHQESFQDRTNYFPSPAVFVYTLPNIMMGELCIRYQISGESSCFIMNEPDLGLLCSYVEDLFQNESYKYCITGWVDYRPDEYKAALFLVEKGRSENNDVPEFGPSFINLIPA